MKARILYVEADGIEATDLRELLAKVGGEIMSANGVHPADQPVAVAPALPESTSGDSPRSVPRPGNRGSTDAGPEPRARRAPHGARPVAAKPAPSANGKTLAYADLTPDQLKVVADAVANGTKAPELGRQLGIRFESASWLMRHHKKATAKARGGPARKVATLRDLSEDHRAKLILMTHQGRSPLQVAAEIGITEGDAARIMTEFKNRDD